MKAAPPIVRAAPVRVLLVEDDPGDVLITREALEVSELPFVLEVVGNGEEALEYLRKQGRFEDASTPHLVLLDLNLPRVTGREVLAAVRADDALSALPIIVLTTSDAEEDVVNAYRLHANAYVTKPVDFTRFREVVRTIDDFFLNVVRLPNLS